MAAPLSFTRGYSVRYPAPDVARGFMLLLIALANVGIWARALGTRFFDTPIDGVLTLLRVAFIDHRAYPLFAILFGFGLMTMVKRRRRQHVDAAIAGLGVQGVPHNDDEQCRSLGERFDREATRSAYRLLASRGGWMLLIGAAHGLLFPGDIIGTYALICLVCARLLARERYRGIIVVGGVLVTLSLIASTVASALFAEEMAQQSTSLVSFDYSLSSTGLLNNFGMWVLVSVFGALSSFAFLGVGVGAWLATTDIVSNPVRYRRTLDAVAAGGLLIAFLGSLPVGLIVSEMINVKLAFWMEPVNHLAGFCGAVGWLALLISLSGPAPLSGQLRGWRWVLSALGRRSMTAYIMQTLLFLPLFMPLNWYGAYVSEFVGVILAVGVWMTTLTFAVLLEYLGVQGPMEHLLRRLVAWSTPVPAGVAALPANNPAAPPALPAPVPSAPDVAPVASSPDCEGPSNEAPPAEAGSDSLPSFRMD